MTERGGCAKNLKEKRKGSKNIFRGLAVLLGTAVLWTVLEKNLVTYESHCETYQGYSIIKEDGEYVYIFDPKNNLERDILEGPKYSLYGDPELRFKLKEGEEYCFTAQTKYFPLKESRIIYIEPFIKPKNQRDEVPIFVAE